MAACLNEEIARKLSPDGLHAAVIVGDASTSTTNVVISETIKHLDVDLFSLFLSVVNLIRPAGIVYDTVVERIDQLAASYNFPVVNILIEVRAFFEFRRRCLGPTLLGEGCFGGKMLIEPSSGYRAYF